MGRVRSWVSFGRLQKIKFLHSATLVSNYYCILCGHYSALKVVVTVPETSLLVLFGCGLSWVVDPFLSFCDGLRWVGSDSWRVGLGWVKENKPTDISGLTHEGKELRSYALRRFPLHNRVRSIHSRRLSLVLKVPCRRRKVYQQEDV